MPFPRRGMTTPTAVDEREFVAFRPKQREEVIKFGMVVSIILPLNVCLRVDKSTPNVKNGGQFCCLRTQGGGFD